MGYPESVLGDDEQVIVHRHPHFKQLIPAVLVLWVGTAVAAFAAGLVNPRPWDPTAKTVVFAVVWTIWLVVVGWLTVWPLLNWLTTHFVITDRRVMFRHGVLTRSGFDVRLAQILRVGFAQRITDRLLRTGTLIVESASRGRIQFSDVPRVARVHSLLFQEVFDNPPAGG